MDGVIARLTRISGRLSVVRRESSDDAAQPLDRTWRTAPGWPALPKQAGRIVCGNLNRNVNFASPLTKQILAQEVEVNTAQVKGNWQQLVSKAKEKWVD